jgi:tetratricopeptide (TPR) repeat protein
VTALRAVLPLLLAWGWLAAGGRPVPAGPPVAPVLPEAFAAAVERTPADPLLLRLREPGALGPAHVSWAPTDGLRCANVGVLAGAWALQPASPAARERLRYWLELMEEHGHELSREYLVPGLAPLSAARERVLRWLASARIETLAGRPETARACVDKARAEPAAPEVPADWFELALAGPPFAADLARARAALAAGQVDEALAAYRSACAGACVARDGRAAVVALLDEAGARFPGDATLAAIRVEPKRRRGRGAQDWARGWALAAVEALKRGERSEAVRRLTAARLLSGPGSWGPGGLASWYWAAEDWLARAADSHGLSVRPELVEGQSRGGLRQAQPERTTEGVEVRLPPAMWLAWTDPEQAVQLAQPQRWAQRAREASDPRLILRTIDTPGRLAEGIVVRLEQEMRQGRFLPATEILEELRRFAALSPDEPLQTRVKALGVLARDGEPPPDPAPLAGGDAERLLAALDEALVAAGDGNSVAAWLALDRLEPEQASHPSASLVSLQVARLTSDSARLAALAAEALQAVPSDARALAARGWAALAAGRLVAALPDLERATASADCPAWAWLARGQTLERLGRLAEAATAFGQAWDRAPGNPAALHGMARTGASTSDATAAGALPSPMPAAREASLRRLLAMLAMGERWRDCARMLEAARGLLPARGSASWAAGEAVVSGEGASLAADLINQGAYGALSALLAELERSSATPPADQAARPADDRPRTRLPTGAALLGTLKRDAREAWTRPASPYGGGFSRPVRTVYRLLLLAIVLAAWVRLHLFLLRLFQRRQANSGHTPKPNWLV